MRDVEQIQKLQACNSQCLIYIWGVEYLSTKCTARIHLDYLLPLTGNTFLKLVVEVMDQRFRTENHYFNRVPNYTHVGVEYTFPH